MTVPPSKAKLVKIPNRSASVTSSARAENKVDVQEQGSSSSSRIRWTKDANAATKLLISLRDEYAQRFEAPK